MNAAVSRSLLVLSLATGACRQPIQEEAVSAPAKSNPDPHVARGIPRPSWQVGDTWVVRYRVQQPTPRGDLQLVEIVWRYRVVEVNASGRVDVLAERTSDDVFGDWHLYFDASGAFVGYHDGSGGEQFPPEPYLPVMDDWNAEALPKDWPGFPLEVGRRTGSSAGVVQEVFDDGVALRVVLHASGTDPGIRVDKTMTQVWEAGRPWWSSLVIESDQHLPEDQVRRIDLLIAVLLNVQVEHPGD